MHKPASGYFGVHNIGFINAHKVFFLEGGGFGEEPEGATVGWEAEEEGQKRSEEEGGDERQRL